MFAAETVTQGGEGVVQVARASELGGLEIVEGNYLHEMERAVGVVTTPTEFAARAKITLSVEQSQNILRGMGIEVPSRIYGKGALDLYIKEAPYMTPQQIADFINAASSISP